MPTSSPKADFLTSPQWEQKCLWEHLWVNWIKHTGLGHPRLLVLHAKAFPIHLQIILWMCIYRSSLSTQNHPCCSWSCNHVPLWSHPFCSAGTFAWHQDVAGRTAVPEALSSDIDRWPILLAELLLLIMLSGAYLALCVFQGLYKATSGKSSWET